MDNKMYQACLPEDFWKMTLEDCYAKNYLDAYSILAVASSCTVLIRWEKCKIQDIIRLKKCIKSWFIR